MIKNPRAFARTFSRVLPGLLILAVSILTYDSHASFTATPSGPNAILVGDFASDTLEFSHSGGLLRHNRFSAADPGFNSDFDFDTAAPGDQTISATGSATVAVDAGDGLDKIIIGTPGSPASGFVITFSINGQGGNDTIEVDDSAEVTARSLTMTSTDLSGLSGLGLTYSGTETITVKTGDGADTIQLESTPASATITFQTNGGSDLIILGNIFGTLDQLAAIVNLQSGSEADLVRLADESDVDANSYTVTESTVLRGSSLLVNFDTDVESLVLNAGNGADVITILGVRSGTEVTVNAGGSNDTMDVGNASNSLDGIVGNLTINGGAGANDVLNVNDTIDTDDNLYVLSSLGMSRTGTGVITTQPGFESITLTTGTGNDSVELDATSVNTKLVLGDGSDTLRFLNGAGLSGGTVDGGIGTDTLDYTNYHTSVNANVATGAATGTGGATNIENLIGGAAADILTLKDSFPGTLLGGPGSDTLTGSGSGQALLGEAGDDELVVTNGNGLIAITGGPDNDRLSVKGTVTSETITITENIGLLSIQGTAPAAYTISGAEIESVNVSTVEGDDTITIQSAPTGVGLTVDGGAGTADTLNVNASNGIDNIDVSGAASTITGATPSAIIFAGVETVNVDALDGADNVTASASTFATIALNGNAPAIAPGDVLLFNTSGVATTHVPGTFTTTGRKPVNYAQFESATFIGLDLGVTVTDIPDPVEVDHTLTYLVTVTNTGSDEATSVVVTETLPPSVNVNSIVTSGTCTGPANVKTCELGALAPGAISTITIEVTVPEEGTLTNSASVTANELDNNPSNNVTTATTTVVGPEEAFGVDLVGEFSNVLQACRTTRRGERCWIRGTFAISNIGDEATTKTLAAVILSDDEEIDETDTLIDLRSGVMQPGRTRLLRFRENIPTSVSLTDRFLIGVVDWQEQQEEDDEDNNISIEGPLD